MANPAQNNLSQDNFAPEAPPLRRPAFNVPIDLGYSLQRFVNSHAHVEDRVLRPLSQHFATSTPLTEEQSRTRMAAILAAAAKASAPTRD